MSSLVAALLLGGCGMDFTDPVEPEQAASEIAVTGAADEPPVLEYETPLVVTETTNSTVWPGAGRLLEDGDEVLLNMYAEDGSTGQILQDTYVASPRLMRMDPASLGPTLYQALKGERVGARVLVTEEDGEVPLALAVDVLPARADGEEIAPAEGLPSVSLDDGAPSIEIPADSAAPDDLEVQPLVRGHGRQVEPGDMVTVRYSGVQWSNGDEFDSNWTTGTVLTAMFGVGTVIDGWEQGLLEQPVGSRVLLVVPPSLAYAGTDSPLAEETLVFVIDILDSRSQVAYDTSSGDLSETEEG
ncbi:FKBP-type peptidyl-prolyl cis-trans isomerase [Paraoerskovia marina]|uniref:FKBP-type peptidyl-prolyl cis-trans isomerase n=1 Tax=Paraoerskovia marina TaxID=545619 RepID=UPI001E4F171B|nr:FKBP-type peptidyl-prolyl cis-trans isomerase [Paraoerskovia marina]